MENDVIHDFNLIKSFETENNKGKALIRLNSLEQDPMGVQVNILTIVVNNKRTHFSFN